MAPFFLHLDHPRQESYREQREEKASSQRRLVKREFLDALSNDQKLIYVLQSCQWNGPVNVLEDERAQNKFS